MAGDPNDWVTRQSRIAASSLYGSTRAGRVGIHVRDDGRDAQGSVEQAEQRKARQIDFARLNFIKIAQLFDLGVEVAVAVEHPLGRAGAAGGEDDRRRIVGPGCEQWSNCGSAVGPQRGQRGAAPKHPSTHRHIEPGLRKSLSQQAAQGLHQRNRDEAGRLGLLQAGDQIFSAHAGIDQNRHGADFQQRKDQRHEVDSRPHQQRQPRAGRHAQPGQAAGDPIAVFVQLRETKQIVARSTGEGGRVRSGHRQRVRLQRGHGAQPSCHVDLQRRSGSHGAHGLLRRQHGTMNQRGLDRPGRKSGLGKPIAVFRGAVGAPLGKRKQGRRI